MYGAGTHAFAIHSVEQWSMCMTHKTSFLLCNADTNTLIRPIREKILLMVVACAERVLDIVSWEKMV